MDANKCSYFYFTNYSLLKQLTMGDSYIGEIRIFAGNFAPQGWAFCDGSLQSIADNTTLFTLIGTTYGGDGQNTFGLPDLRGRVPLHQGSGPGLSPYVIGQSGGSESVTLQTSQLPLHNHILSGNSANANTTDPTNNFLAAQPGLLEYSPGPPGGVLNSASTGSAGGSQPHENRMPILGVNYIISLFGIFPSRN